MSYRKQSMQFCEKCGEFLPMDYKFALCEPCQAKPCKHGNTEGECDLCDQESDHAYDCAREARFFR